MAIVVEQEPPGFSSITPLDPLIRGSYKRLTPRRQKGDVIALPGVWNKHSKGGESLCGCKRDARRGSRYPGHQAVRPGGDAAHRDGPSDGLAQARASGSLLEPGEVAEVVTFMLTRRRGMTLRDMVTMPTNVDLPVAC